MNGSSSVDFARTGIHVFYHTDRGVLFSIKQVAIDCFGYNRLLCVVLDATGRHLFSRPDSESSGMLNVLDSPRLSWVIPQVLDALT